MVLSFWDELICYVEHFGKLQNNRSWLLAVYNTSVDRWRNWKDFCLVPVSQCCCSSYAFLVCVEVLESAKIFNHLNMV